MALLKRYRDIVNRFFGLPREDKVLLGESWIELLRSIIVLRTPWRMRELAGGGDDSYDGRRDREISHIEDILGFAASHHIKNISCLESSLALRNILRKRGINLTLEIGVNRDDNGLGAHAWLGRGRGACSNEGSDYSKLKSVNGDGD